MTLRELNSLAEASAADAFSQCCASSHWIDCMVAARPYANMESILIASDAVWSHCQKKDFLQAFEAHPKIGDIDSLKSKYASTRTTAGKEQSGVDSADEATLQALATGNQQYEDKFGYIFIVCATGKSASEMLALLQARLQNNPEDELPVAASEQHKITRLRLSKLVKDVSLPNSHERRKKGALL